MTFLIAVIFGVFAGLGHGALRGWAMTPLGDALLGLGGGLAGAALVSGFGLQGWMAGAFGGVIGGLAMTVFVFAVRDGERN